MNYKNTRRGNTQQVINKNCHSKFNLESHRFLLSKVRSRIKYGMTGLLNNGGFTARSVTPQCRYAGYSGRPGFILRRHTELESGSRCSMKKEEALNKSSFRAPLRSGFTLIELLVVVLIIGILAAVAVPQYQKAVAKSRFTQAKVIAQSLAEAEEVYYLANGKYTRDFNDLDITIGGEISKEIPTYHFYKWGNCLLNVHDDDGRAETLCTVTVPSGEVTYWIGLKHSTYDTNRKCLAAGNTEKPAATDISYRICESETQNTQKMSFGSYTYSWNYK